jgi:phospholipid/cholesterol/gamma-HCH transport system permease protein
MGQLSSQPLGYILRIESEKNGEVLFSVSGRIALENLKPFQSDLESLQKELSPSKLSVDLSGVNYLDSAGALVLLQFENQMKARSIPFQWIRMTDEVQGIMGLLDPSVLITTPVTPLRRSDNLVEQIGEVSIRFLNDFFQVITFVGDLLLSLIYSLLHPRSMRWEDVFFYMKRAGVDGLPIVGLISFLLGLIIAFMSSLQLKQFGANIFVASLVSIAMVRELGPIMTAIIVAGRSGSAFAAEIGTMMVNEEVDALIVMGFEPTRFLAVPKVLATMIVVPLLTFYSDLFGILGGLMVGVIGLDLTVYTYIQETLKSIRLFDLTSSLVKSVVFAYLISSIGCLRGFQVKGGAEGVGISTTSAVVSGLFLIIVADSAFAVIFYYI